MAKKKLEGSLSLRQRVEIAKDVVARFESKQRRLVAQRGIYLSGALPKEGELRTDLIKVGCRVCARGALFLASVDRHDRCNMRDFRDCGDSVVDRTNEDFGVEQADLIEGAFEGWPNGRDYFELHGNIEDPKRVLLAIVRNMIVNGGLFRPELELKRAISADL